MELGSSKILLTPPRTALKKTAHEVITASAPGSLMLMGEHAVLHGHPALVMAVDKRISVTLIPRADSDILICSSLGEYKTSLQDLKIEAPFQFVLTAIDSCRRQIQIPQGFELHIESEFSSHIGFGSSAAVVVATLNCLRTWLGNVFLDNPTQNTSDSTNTSASGSASASASNALFHIALDIIRSVQGMGSGADVAASVYGGVLFYRQDEVIKKLEHPLHFVALYSGYKTFTWRVVQMLEEKQNQYPELYHRLFMAIAACTEQGFRALEAENWTEFGRLMNVHQGLHSALGVSERTLDTLFSVLRDRTEMYGAKISGAGLGDCVIGFGKMDPEGLESLSQTVHETIPTVSQFLPMPVDSTKVGVRCE